MKNSRRILIVATLALVAGLCLLIAGRRPVDEETLYQQWLDGPTTFNRIVSFQRHLSPRASRLLGLPYFKERSMARYHDMERRLLASGYLTHYVVPITNAESRATEISQCLLRASLSHDISWQYYLRDHQVILTCRTKDTQTIFQSMKSLLPKAEPTSAKNPQ
ncbi:MAG: hypothetical protein IT581_22250 [Verrucomicrobiales bacterium]|nr:hypothetical protein [Verrucomicrobiales bacterium]